MCAKSGGLLRERMRLVADLWAAGIRAEMMMTAAPSLTDQYEHANGRHIPWLVIMEASKLSASDTVKVSGAGHCTLSQPLTQWTCFVFSGGRKLESTQIS